MKMHVATAITVTLVLATSMAGWAAGKQDNSNRKVASAQANGAGKTADGEAPAAKPDTVHVYIQTVPPRKAQVKWGRKNLGMIPVPRPLVVERPRDSGPMDLAIRATGYLPVHTRAYTFTDSRVAVKLTPPAEKNTLFGYREDPTPSPDAGVPATAVPVVGPAIPEPPKP